MIVIGLLKEIFYSLFYLYSGLLGYFYKLDSLNPNPTKTSPIVFVHGWFTQNPFYEGFKKYFEGLGYRVYMTNFGLQFGDLYEYSRKLDKYIKKRKLKNVILVGMSEGSVIGLIYLQKLNGWENVNKFFGVCGPFKGTPLAYLVAFSKAARQQFPNGEIARDLKEEKIINKNKIVCLYTKFDEIVPKYSSQIKGAKNVEMPVVGHVYIQVAQETIKLIDKHLNS